MLNLCLTFNKFIHSAVTHPYTQLACFEDFYNGEDSSRSLPGCNAVWCCRNIPIFRRIFPWRWRRHGPPKRRYPTTTAQGVTIQNARPDN